MVGKLARKLAPRTIENLAFLSRSRAAGGDIFELLRAYQEDIQELKLEMNELRRDQRRMAELYDLVFERVRQENPPVS